MSKRAGSKDEPLDKPVSSRTRSALPKPAANSFRPSNPPPDTLGPKPRVSSNESPQSSAPEEMERNSLPDTSQQAPDSSSKGSSSRDSLDEQEPNVQTDVSQHALTDIHNLFPYDGAIQKSKTSRQASSSAIDSYFTDLFRQFLRAQYSWSPPVQEHCTEYISDSATGNPLVFFNEKQLSEEGRRHVIESLRLDFRGDKQTFKLCDAGMPYPFRGHGPVWLQNSCSLDCCIVAARLLNVGSTAADADGKTREAWLKSLDKLPRAFIHLLSKPWESLDRQTNIETRHRFWDHDLPPLGSGQPNRNRFASASHVWNLCTKSMGQFAFQSRDSYTDCHNCGSTPPEQTFQPRQALSLDIYERQVKEIKEQHQGNNPTLAQLLAREFNTFPKRCSTCKVPDGRTRRREIQGDLPLRLVIVPGEFAQKLVTKATSNDVRFRYHSTEGEKTAAYRWLGGIYHAHHHFRLYWTDRIDDLVTTHIKIYDGLCASGAIVGGIPVPSASQDDQVPEYWSKAPVVLFYERISEEGVSAARENISRQLEAATAREMEGAVGGPVEPPRTGDQMQSNVIGKRKQEGWETADSDAAEKRVRHE
ncbi:MAG: hypothetical protein Q9183_005139 [Haloplaca sp. 2 TL-2023]